MSATAVRTRTFSRSRRWQAPAVDGNAVQKSLQQLWMEISEEKRVSNGHPRPSLDVGVMRTRTINLVAVADSAADVGMIKRAVNGLTEFFPSRTLILLRHLAVDAHDGLDVTVEVEEHVSERFKTPIRFETVTVSTGNTREELLASVASPILVPELPDFVWYPSGTFVDSRLLGELVNTADRLIVDTAYSTDPSAAMRYLVSVQRRETDRLQMSDAAWTRLTPWRQMIAQFFDLTANLPYLNALDEVTITYAGTDENGRSGLTAGLLAVGWLCTRLGWRAPGEELVKTRTGWKLTLRAGERGRSREVIVHLRVASPDVENAKHEPSLVSIDLEATSDPAARFSAKRVSEDGVETSSDTETSVNRIVYMRDLDDSTLLSLELRVFAEDAVYVEALNFAANLWPEGVGG